MSEIKHWGVLGMKWGRRKAQSPRSTSSDHKTASALKKKHLSEMSNDELKKLTARLQLEKQYKDLTKVELTGGKKAVAEILTGVGKQVATKYITDAVSKGVGLLIDALKKK